MFGSELGSKADNGLAKSRSILATVRGELIISIN